MMKKTGKFPRLLWFSGAIAALGGFLFGFDMAVVSGVLPLVSQQYDLDAVQQGWFVSSALLGCIIGVIFSGTMADRYGRRPAIALTAILFLISTLGTALCPSLSAIITFRIIGGVGVGLASCVVPLYISEIAPASVRGRMVTYYQLAVTMGILVAYLSNSQLLQAVFPDGLNQMAWFNYLFNTEVWRGMFLVGGVPALLFLVGVTGIPESPRWLFEKQRRAEGTALFEKLTGEKEPIGMEHQVKVESSRAVFRELLSPKLRPALLLGILLPLFSQFCGINAIIYYGPSILREGGMSLERSLDSQIIFGLVNMLCTFIAVWTVDRLGRRPLYLYGSAAAGLSLILLGLCFYSESMDSLFMLLSVFIFLASFAFSLGPLKFVVASEIFPANVRGRAMAISITVMWVADLIVGQLTPMLMERWGIAQTFWMFACFCALAFLAVYRLLPETKGLTLEQIEDRWSSK